MGLWGLGTDPKVLFRMEERRERQQVSQQSPRVRDKSVVTSAPLVCGHIQTQSQEKHSPEELYSQLPGSCLCSLFSSAWMESLKLDVTSR